MATQTIISRFKERNLKTHLLTTLSLNYRLDKTRREWFFEQIKPLKNSEFLNRDFSPRGLFYGLAFAYSFISPQTKNVFKILSKGNLPYITVLILMIFLLGIFLSRKSKNKLNLNILWLISFSGFSGIAFELILILGFQVIYGFIYAWVGVLSGAFMSGLASGSFILSRSLNKIKNDFATLLKFEFAIIAFSLALPVLIFVLSKANQQTLASLTKLIFIAVSFIAGFLLGAEFPLANKIYFARQEFVNSGAQLYAADLTGACLGAIISSVVLIPILGIWETGLFIACLKLAAVIAIIFSVRK
jgi:spermidine synthase